jgi:DNA mismatch repair ATPase MutS
VDESKFQFIFAQDNIRYFKHAVVSDMDEKIGDIKSIILDRQKMLMLHIEDSLLDAEPQLQHISIIMATLDALISLGSCFL